MVFKENNNETYTYPYAIGDEGKPISITEITKQSRHDSRYYCYGCGAELFPVLGDKREHHFRHEKGSICDPDKYLHEFAKATLKKKFEENNTFVVKYNARQICKNANNCELYKLYGWPECEHEGLYEIDLKKYYDICIPEKGYYQDLPDGRKKYVADLILTNSQEPARAPISLEVWVTHECTEDKKQNGGRIIEIKINCEKDANRPIIENDDDPLPIHFYNFKNPVEIESGRKFKHIKIMPGLGQKVVVTDETPCSEGLLYDPKGENEVILSTTSLDVNSMELLYAIKCNERGITFSHLQICENGHIHQKTLRCQYLHRQCPCGNFKYSKQKGEKIMEMFKNIQIWELPKIR